MKREEAEKMLEIMMLADGGCPYNAKKLFSLFVKEFPDFSGLAKEIFKKRFGEEFEETEESIKEDYFLNDQNASS